MGPLEWEKWERFLKTGRVCDYLSYRMAAGPWEEPEEGVGIDAERDADRDQGGGALGQEYGKL